MNKQQAEYEAATSTLDDVDPTLTTDQRRKTQLLCVKQALAAYPDPNDIDLVKQEAQMFMRALGVHPEDPLNDPEYETTHRRPSSALSAVLAQTPPRILHPFNNPSPYPPIPPTRAFTPPARRASARKRGSAAPERP